MVYFVLSCSASAAVGSSTGGEYTDLLQDDEDEEEEGEGAEAEYDSDATMPFNGGSDDETSVLLKE